MPHADPEHALKVQLATALRERDEALSREAMLALANRTLAGDVIRCAGIESERDALRAEVQRLRKTLVLYAHCRHACIECFCVKEARAALCTGGDRG